MRCKQLQGQHYLRLIAPFVVARAAHLGNTLPALTTYVDDNTTKKGWTQEVYYGVQGSTQFPFNFPLPTDSPSHFPPARADLAIRRLLRLLQVHKHASPATAETGAA